MSTEENKLEHAPTAAEKQRLSQKSVMNYLLVLFAAAFCLLILTLLMEQRTNDELVDQMYEQVNYAQTSHTEASTARDQLAEELDLAEEEIQALSEMLTALEADYINYVEATSDALTAAEATISDLEARLAEIQLAEDSEGQDSEN